MSDEDRKLVLLPKPETQSVTAQLQRAKEEIYAESMSVLRDAGHAHEIFDDETGKAYPADHPETIAALQRWELELGSRRAAKMRLKACQMALRPPKDTPFALHIAKSVYSGMLKADAISQMGERTLNVNFVTITLDKDALPPILDTSAEVEKGKR